MSLVEFRDFDLEDLDRTSEIIDKIWNYREFGQSEELCRRKGYRDVLGALADSNYRKVAVIDKKIVGFIFARVYGEDVDKDPELDREYQWIVKENERSENGRLFNDYAQLFLETNKVLADSYPHTDASEIVYFCTDPDYQKLGLGKRMVTDFLEFLHNCGKTEKVMVFTDSTCNTGFYERLGFQKKKALERYAPLRRDHLTFYLYTYQND